MLFANKNKKGFTLLELLVVMSIISLLVTLAISVLNNARKNARDSRRMADLRHLQTALELYLDQYNTLPTTGSYGEGAVIGGCTGGWDCSHYDQDESGDGDFVEFLVSSGIMNIPPDDPIDDSDHHFRYYYYAGTGTTYNCERPYYVLVAYGLETTNFTDDIGVCYSSSWVALDSRYIVVGGPNY